MEAYLEQVERLLKEHGLSEKYHVKVKDHSMLRVIDIESKRRVFVKEELCEQYLEFLRADAEHFETQFDKVNDLGYIELS